MKSKAEHPSELCERFAQILDSTPSVVNGVCLATRSRANLHPVVLERKAESLMFVPQAFSFENMDRDGKALCLGETVILQEEINPFLSVLREHGIIVTALHNHWLFDRPRLMYLHFEAIDKPLSFARKVREAMNEMITDKVGVVPRVKTSDYNLSGLCDKFNDLLGGMIHTSENGVCTVMSLRTNIHPVVLGRKAKSFLLLTQMFAFESMTRDGFALCSGETVILQEEINPFITRLREHGIIVTAVHNHWLFDQPRLMYMHFESVDQPIPFASKVQDALSVLDAK